MSETTTPAEAKRLHGYEFRTPDEAKQDTSRRRAILRVSPEVFAALLTTAGQKHTTILEGIPDGARFIRGQHDFQSDCFELVFEHESFDEVETGRMLPVLQVVVRVEDAESNTEHLPCNNA